MSMFFAPKVIETPALLGKTIHEAIRITSYKNLSLRLLDEKEDPDLPVGTIISQNPISNCPIKAHQSIMVVVSKKTDRKAPQLVGKSTEQIQEDLKKLSLTSKIYYVPGPQPQGLCVAQDPAPGSNLTDTTITLYMCKGKTGPYLFPNLRNKNLQITRTFLSSAPVNLEIIHSNATQEPHDCDSCVVTDQHPRAGSIVTLDTQKPIHVQLMVSPATQA